MKKFLALAMVVMMFLGIMTFANAEAYTGEIKLWVADNTADLTKTLVENFKAANPEYASLNVVIESVSEAEAANNMIADVEAGADIYCFAQDQLTRLIAANALEILSDENAEIVKKENDGGAVSAVTVGEYLYAYPMTSDNGYFMYYDKSVVTDPSTLEQVLADCEAAGKNFHFQLNSGWYNAAFFFGAGCNFTYDVDSNGQFIAINTDYATNDAAVTAMKSMIKMAKSPVYVNNSSAGNATNLGAIVTGTWDAGTVQQLLGDNYAAAKLPTVDGYQLGGFGGFKLMGVKPQTDLDKLTACDALALYLTSGEAQLARYDAVKWGPSNLEAQQSEAVKADPALAALAEQLNFCIGQGQYPTSYWTPNETLGDQIVSGMFNDYTDEQLKQVLVDHVASCSADVVK